jgi:hypothetical protein
MSNFFASRILRWLKKCVDTAAISAVIIGTEISSKRMSNSTCSFHPTRAKDSHEYKGIKEIVLFIRVCRNVSVAGIAPASLLRSLQGAT